MGMATLSIKFTLTYPFIHWQHLPQVTKPYQTNPTQTICVFIITKAAGRFLAVLICSSFSLVNSEIWIWGIQDQPSLCQALKLDT